MRFWKREANLIIGASLYDMSKFRFEFKVTFEDRPKIGTCELTVYNLNESTRSGIEKGQTLILNAGYEDDIGGIFVGEVFEAKHEHNGLDWLTKIKGVDSMDAWMGTYVNKTYNGPITANEVLDDLLNIFGLEVSTRELVENKIYPRQKLCQGRIRDVIRSIVVNDCKSRLLIRNGQIIINDPRDGQPNGYLLSAETGLLKTNVEEAKQSADSTDRPEKQTQDEKVETPPTMTVECLLNYRIGCNDLIQIQGDKLNGGYCVIKGEHTGTPDRDWKTTLEVKTA